MDCSLIATLLFTKTENPTTGFLDEPHKVFDNMQDRNRKMITKYKLCIRSLQKTSRWGTAGFPTSAENIGRGGSVQRKWGMHPLWEKGSSKFGACVCVCGGGREPFKISLGEGLKSIYWGACGGLPRKGKISCEGLYRSLWAEKYYFAAKFETQLN